MCTKIELNEFRANNNRNTLCIVFPNGTDTLNKE